MVVFCYYSFGLSSVWALSLNFRFVCLFYVVLFCCGLCRFVHPSNGDLCEDTRAQRQAMTYELRFCCGLQVALYTCTISVHFFIAV